MGKKHQEGSAHVVAIVCLVLALIVALGWIFYQNFANKETITNDATVSVADKPKTEDKSEVPQLPQDVTYTTKSNERGLAIDSKTAIEARTDLSESLKAFLVKTLTDYTDDVKKGFEGCDDPKGITVGFNLSRVYKQKYATGDLGAGNSCGGGGAVFLWADVDGGWREIGATHSQEFECEDLEKYKIPSEIAGSKCIASDGSGTRVYSQD